MKSFVFLMTTASVLSICLSLSLLSPASAQASVAPSAADRSVVEQPTSAPGALAATPTPATTPAASPEGTTDGAPGTQAEAPAATPAPGAMAEAAAAQPAVTGSCFAPPGGASVSEVEAFLANPQSLVSTGVASPVLLSNRVRALAGADIRAIDSLLDLSKNVDADKAAAIGAGLGRAAFGCASVNPAYAALIQGRVAERGAGSLVTAFLAASNDLQVAALGSGAGASGGAAAAGLVGGGQAGPFSAGLGGDETVPTTVETYTFQGQRIIAIDNNDGDGNGDGCDSSVSPSCAN